MAEQGISFTRGAASRIVKTVRGFERSQTQLQQRKHRKGADRGGGGTATPVSFIIVLIDEDITGIDETDPAEMLVEADIPLGEGEETWTVIFQDPPDADYDLNNVPELNLWKYKRKQVALKYFESAGSETGTATGQDTNKITLAAEASTVDDYYVGDMITTEGQTLEIIAYDGTTQEATVEADWDPAIEGDQTYTITLSKDRKLATTTINDEANERKIVRYSTTNVWYDDGKSFLVGEYQRSDFPEYPENDAFPPDGTGTYAVLDEGFLKRRYRGIAIEGVLILALCRVLPPPELPEA